MTAVTLPTWLDADVIRTVLLLSVVAILMWAYVVARFARAIVGRAAAAIVAIVLVVVLLGQRSNLEDCVRDTDCECTFVGLEVQLPDEVDRLRCG
ncbi:MAG: hypothetical protein AAGA99_14795 [Actinomycetota bacterium]